MTSTYRSPLLLLLLLLRLLPPPLPSHAWPPRSTRDTTTSILIVPRSILRLLYVQRHLWAWIHLEIASVDEEVVRRNPSWRRGEGREIGPVLAYCVFDNSELKRDIFGEWNSRGTTGGFHSRIRGGLLARRSTVAKALRRAYLTRHLPTVDSIYTPLRVLLAFQPAGCVRAAARWPPCGAFLIAWYRDIREIRAGRDHYDRFRLVNGVSPAISGIAGNLLLPRLIRIGRGNKGNWPLKRRIKNYQSQYSRFLSTNSSQRNWRVDHHRTGYILDTRWSYA